MSNTDCIMFLQWALPQLHMRWPGFRKVHKQVCKRLHRRIAGLTLNSIDDYRRYLDDHPEEWRMLDSLCQVTVSRFYRDKRMFSLLEQELLPSLARQAMARREHSVRVWSAGCASGEEPYTLGLIWQLHLATQFPGINLQILATDINAQILQRAAQARYAFSTVKNLPPAMRDVSFTVENQHYCLRPTYRTGIEFRQHDIRTPPPAGPFDLIMCRNLVLTYFDWELQRTTMADLWHSLAANGVLIIGIHEQLPKDLAGFMPWSERYGMYIKTGGVDGEHPSQT